MLTCVGSLLGLLWAEIEGEELSPVKLDKYPKCHFFWRVDFNRDLTLPKRPG